MSLPLSPGLAATPVGESAGVACDAGATLVSAATGAVLPPAQSLDCLSPGDWASAPSLAFRCESGRLGRAIVL